MGPRRVSTPTQHPSSTSVPPKTAGALRHSPHVHSPVRWGRLRMVVVRVGLVGVGRVGWCGSTVRPRLLPPPGWGRALHAASTTTTAKSCVPALEPLLPSWLPRAVCQPHGGAAPGHTGGWGALGCAGRAAVGCVLPRLNNRGGMEEENAGDGVVVAGVGTQRGRHPWHVRGPGACDMCTAGDGCAQG